MIIFMGLQALAAPFQLSNNSTRTILLKVTPSIVKFVL
jgi:hypothetical protein